MRFSIFELARGLPDTPLVPRPVPTLTRAPGPPVGPGTNFPCLVHLKIARDVPRLLEFAILVWTIPAPVVQIHIAIPATDASGRVERLHHSANSLKRGRRLSF